MRKFASVRIASYRLVYPWQPPLHYFLASCSLPASGEEAFRMQISWDDVNRTQRAGLHFVVRLRIDVFISQRAIENWRTDPVGCHNIVEITTSHEKNYGLGAFGPCRKD